MTKSVTSGQVRAAMMAANITRVEHHDCALCGYMTAYVRDGETVHFDPGCYCTDGTGWRRASFDDIADWINMQTMRTWAVKLAARVGIVLDEPVSVNAVGQRVE